MRCGILSNNLDSEIFISSFSLPGFYWNTVVLMVVELNSIEAGYNRTISWTKYLNSSLYDPPPPQHTVWGTSPSLAQSPCRPCPGPARRTASTSSTGSPSQTSPPSGGSGARQCRAAGSRQRGPG